MNDLILKIGQYKGLRGIVVVIPIQLIFFIIGLIATKVLGLKIIGL